METPPAGLLAARLRLRPFTLDDAAFILELVNDPDWLRYIGDKRVRTEDDARRYLREGPLASYARHGFGLLAVETRADGRAIGMCGLLKREALPDADVGFAFLPAARGHGYAAEALGTLLADAPATHGLRRVLAITSPGNVKSIGVLERAGFRYERTTKPSDDADEVRVYALDL